MLDFYKLMNQIEEYHYLNTEQGRRERGLNLIANQIILTPDFPYFDLGIKKIGIRIFDIDFEVFNCYTLYVDLSFLFSYFYREHCDDENFYIDNIIIISNDYDLSNMRISYSKHLSSDIDLSNFEYIVSENNEESHYFNSHECLNILKSKVKFDLPYDEIEIEYIIDNNFDIKNSLKIFNQLSFNFGKKIDKRIDLYIYMDYLKGLEFLKLFMPKLNKNYNNIYLNIVLGIKGDYTNCRKFKSDINLDGYKNRFDFPDFKFLKPYKSKFKYMNIDITNYIEI